MAVPPADLASQGDGAGTVNPSPYVQRTSFADVRRYWHDK